MNITPEEQQAIERLMESMEAAAAVPDEEEPPPGMVEELARAVLAAPEKYWQLVPDKMAQQWREWALGIIERIDYAPFFTLLHEMADMPRDEIPPEHFQRMVELAPPRFLDAGFEAAKEYLPTATHCDDEGNPVFSVHEVAEHFGKTTEEVERDIERLGLTDRLHTGPVHPLQ